MATKPAASAHNLSSQMRRCSIAVASQLADAYSRSNRSERIRLLSLARATLFELDTHIRVSIDLQALDPAYGIEADLSMLERTLTASLQKLREQPDRYGALRVVGRPARDQPGSGRLLDSAKDEPPTSVHQPRVLRTRT